MVKTLQELLVATILLIQGSKAFVYEDLPAELKAKLDRVEPSVLSTKYFSNLFYGTSSSSETYITSLKQDNELVQIVFNNQEETDPQAAQAFVDAAEFWNGAIGETTLPSVSTGGDNPVEFCGLDGADFENVPTVFSTIIIAAQTVFIDGRGGTLAAAGPCATAGGFTRIGIMSFDSADVEELIDDGDLELVIRHEMGHVIGIGTMWANLGLVANPCTSFNPCNTNPTYVGENGLEGFSDLGGTGDLLVADQGGQGTANGHWREDTFENELMTGFLSNGDNPISIMTLKALLDLGYDVNLNVAETFQIPGVELPGSDEDEDSGDSPTSAPTYIIDMGEDTTNNDGEGVDELSIIDGSGISAATIAVIAVATLLVVGVLVAVQSKRSKAKNVNRSQRFMEAGNQKHNMAIKIPQ
eukprot:maker-scaffold_6-snap-gene-18.37-mRNA-1 protein AED:0.00 eAED:0.00 QI:63/1/0.5/1/1/1/2/101/412